MVGYGISVHPILSLASLKSLPIPDGSIVTPLEDLDDFDRRSILAAINQCETQLRENRAKRAGIVTATPQAAKASIEAARKAGVRLPGDAGADGEPIVRLK